MNIERNVFDEKYWREDYYNDDYKNKNSFISHTLSSLLYNYNNFNFFALVTPTKINHHYLSI